MQRILLISTLFALALGQSCDILSTACSGVSCPTAPSIQVSTFNYAPSDFNLISFGSVTINHGDVEGRVAVKQSFNAQSDGVSIGFSLSNSSSTGSYSLVAGGDVNWNDGEIYPSNSGLYVGGSFSGASTLKSKATTGAGSLDSQFSTLSTYFTGVSNALAGVAVTANASLVYQQLSIQCNQSSSVYYAAISASVFSGVTSYTTVNCDASAVFVINIMGAGSVRFQGEAFTSHVALFNLPMATQVTVDTFIYGSLIAPLASLNQTAGTIAGQVVVATSPILVQVNLPWCPNATTSTGSATSTGAAASTSTTGAAPPAGSTSTSGVPSASSTTGSNTPTGNGAICTFLDDQAQCANVVSSINGSDYTFVYGSYDVIVFGDLTSTSGDIEGRTFASGAINFPNGQFSVGLRAASSNNYVLIGGSINFASGSINHGRAFSAGSISSADYLRKQIDGPCSSSGCLDNIRSTGQTCYNGVSDTFASRSNAAITMNGGQATLSCNSNSDSVYYINVDSSAITAASYGSTSNCNNGAVFVLNIGGSDDFTFSGASFPTNNVVYNVRGSRTVTIGTSVHGNVLAPQSNVVMNSGLIVGKLVAQSATIVQVNVVPECVDSGSDGSSLSGNGSNGSENSGMNLTPSFLVMIIALFISKMF